MKKYTYDYLLGLLSNKLPHRIYMKSRIEVAYSDSKFIGGTRFHRILHFGNPMVEQFGLKEISKLLKNYDVEHEMILSENNDFVIYIATEDVIDLENVFRNGL